MSNNNFNWFPIIQKIVEQNCTPIISNQLINDALFGRRKVVRDWAENLYYPLADSHNLTRVAQFLSVSQNTSQAKSLYLHFLKEKLLALARAEPEADQTFLDSFKGSKLHRLTFSQLSEALRYPDFEKEEDNSLCILAALDIPIYITTSHHYFMEAALQSVGKTPRTGVYSWRQGLEKKFRPEFMIDTDFDLDVDNPLVYHLHGLDDYSDSLVLTEDDYLEFLVNITNDFNNIKTFPTVVRIAFNSWSLLLLGYELHDWDLRVLLQGFIKGHKPFRQRSVAIQLMPNEAVGVRDSQQFQEYLQKYFGKVEFDIYWGDTQQFMLDLQKEL